MTIVFKADSMTEGRRMPSRRTYRPIRFLILSLFVISVTFFSFVALWDNEEREAFKSSPVLGRATRRADGSIHVRSLSPTSTTPKDGVEMVVPLRFVLHIPSAFVTRRIGAALIASHSIDPNKSHANDVPVSAADMARARRNVLRPLPAEPPAERVDAPADARSATPSAVRRAAEAVMSTFANHILRAATDAAPVVADYGCRLAPSFAARHAKSTVLCVSDDAIGAAPLARQRTPNLIRLAARGGLGAGAAFDHFFAACDFVTVATLFTAIAPLQRDAAAAEALLEVAARALQNSGAVFALLPFAPDVCGRLEEKTRAYFTPNITGEKWPPKAPLPFVSLRCELLGEFHSGEETVLWLFRVTVIDAMRLCRKTWNSPLVLWRRAVARHFHEGRLHYHVMDLSLTETEKASRRIYPIQYVPSMNLDILLGAGLTVYERLRVFGAMLSTPLYTDPLPHNWMIGNEDGVGVGARVFRIDKVDTRYEKSVQEEKTYWAASARGYMRLLSYSLCLSNARDGMPDILHQLHAECKAECRACVTTCTYMPRKSLPCVACRNCGNCVLTAVEGNVHIEGHPSRPLVQSETCKKDYRSFTHAMSVWNSWRKYDEHHPITF